MHRSESRSANTPAASSSVQMTGDLVQSLPVNVSALSNARRSTHFDVFSGLRASDKALYVIRPELPTIHELLVLRR